MGVIASTIYGEIEGIDENGISTFRGIPFAKPPIGDLRFRAPERPDKWTGVRDATQAGAAPPQVSDSYFPAMSPREIDEDCLYLNVWTPAADAGGRPVMVWIHGGGFLSGAGSLPWYRGNKIAARHDVVVVSINYRLGALGFMYLNELASPELGASTNIGMRDQIAALEWVRENIESFGGDPGNVTIFGESAGGMSVGTLLGTPSAKGLFQKAIMQSGAAHNAMKVEDATVIAERFLELVGIDPSDTAQLRNVEWQKLIDSYEKITVYSLKTLLGFLPFMPVVDGDLLPKAPAEALFDGLSADVPVMVGTNENEMNLFAIMDTGMAEIDEEGLAHRIERHYAVEGTGRDHARKIWAAYEEVSASSEAIPLDLMTDVVFRIPAIRACETQSQHQPRTFQYLFNFKSPAAPNGATLDSFHGLEIPFVFGNADEPVAAFLMGDDPGIEGLSAAMMEAWTTFARTGSPAAAGLPDWPEYELEKRNVMLLGTKSRVESDPEARRRAVWEGLL